MAKIQDVKKDGNCLFWAIMISYLEQVKTNEQIFKNRYKLLFDSEKDYEKYFRADNIQTVLEVNDHLVRIFRKHICDYIEKNLTTNRGENKTTFESAILDSEINKKYKNYILSKPEQITNYLEQMKKAIIR